MTRVTEKQENKGAWIKGIVSEMTPPSLNDNTADMDRLVKAIGKILPGKPIVMDYPMIGPMTGTLRKCGYRVEAVLFEDGDRWHLADVLPVTEDHALFGIAVDLGTSTLVVRLLNLNTGETLDESSFHNPQIDMGADILTRIHFSATDGGLQELQGLVKNRLNQEIRTFCEKHGIDSYRIAGASVAGNTTMTHLFLGLDPHWICREPYIPIINSPGLIKASDLGLSINPGAPVLVFPNVGSYFGGDLIAGILASGMARENDVSLLVDVGTNAEVVIGNREWLMACAGAAGPALEGGVANMGMMAGPGVIDKVTFDPQADTFRIRTIDSLEPVGICGSGLIDLVAQLYLYGMIDLRGKFVSRRCGNRLVEVDGIRELVVVPAEKSGNGKPLTLAQTDVDGLIRSKAAMFTILITLTNTVNIPLGEIHRFFVAGTFGSYMDPRSAITLGMIPDLPLDRYVSLGNTSLEGAALALLSAEARKNSATIRDRVTYLELNVNQEFMNLFSAAKFIPHTERSLFPSVKPYGMVDNLRTLKLESNDRPLAK
jgi:uncharacterized 2Fe-2S/4Fe-4S cluster protein (DUF4445 family)